MAMLVPEGRLEVTTEGGLQVAGNERVCERSSPDCATAGFPRRRSSTRRRAHRGGRRLRLQRVRGTHGPYAAAYRRRGDPPPGLSTELERVRRAGEQIVGLGMRFNAGHALNYVNVGLIAALPAVWELHIGHSIVSRAIYIGMRDAVREMKAAIASAMR